MKMYLSGAMHGLPKEQQEKFFRNEAERVQLRGWIPVLPYDIPADHRSHGDTAPCPRAYSPSAACFMRGDLIQLLQCDAIVMIGEWHDSVGALREHDVAAWTGIPVFCSVDDVPKAGIGPGPYVDQPKAGDVRAVPGRAHQVYLEEDKDGPAGWFEIGRCMG